MHRLTPGASKMNSRDNHQVLSYGEMIPMGLQKYNSNQRIDEVS